VNKSENFRMRANIRAVEKGIYYLCGLNEQEGLGQEPVESTRLGGLQDSAQGGGFAQSWVTAIKAAALKERKNRSEAQMVISTSPIIREQRRYSTILGSSAPSERAYLLILHTQGCAKSPPWAESCNPPRRVSPTGSWTKLSGPFRATDPQHTIYIYDIDDSD
jgi:hypothetical protein